MVALLWGVVGCVGPWQSRILAERREGFETPSAPEAQEASEPAQSQAVDQQALAQMIAELDEIGTLDPDLKKKLIDDLKNTKPALWGPTIQVYRGAIAYRKQADQREAQAEQPADSLVDQAVHHTQGGSQKQAARIASAVDDQKPAVQTVSANTTLRKASPVLDQPAVVERPAPPDDAVAAVASDQVAPGDWQTHLEQAIQELEQAAAETGGDGDQVAKHAALRLLYLAQNQREQALRPIAGMSTDEQEFLSSQLYGLSEYLDRQGNADPQRRASAARRHLSKAVAKLSELSQLNVSGLAFCTEISSFGVFTKFDRDEFAPGQEVLLYAEVENFQSQMSEKGYRTVLRSSYQILDARGARVFDDDFGVIEDVCQRRREDFFMRYRLWIPDRIYDGPHTLKLTIEDETKQQVGQATIKFEVRSKRPGDVPGRG